MAAFSVFFGHAITIWYHEIPGSPTSHLLHRSVIVFFVLSGYVITHSTLPKHLDARRYVQARLSRLYSVLLPALALTLFLQIIGTALNPAFYQHYERSYDAVRYALAAFFLQSLWMTNTCPPTNGPLWSLGYEFWYYALFGVAVMVKSVRWKIGSLLVLVLICGVNVLILMPNWLMGVGCYCYGRRLPISTKWARACFWFMMVVVVSAVFFLPDKPFTPGAAPLFFSGAFLTDLLIGLFLMVLIWLFDHAFGEALVPGRLEAGVRWFADHTFSLYLYHFPLLCFAVAVVPFDRGSLIQTGTMLGLILLIILGLGVVTESKRPLWRAFFGRTWDFFANLHLKR